MSKIRAGGRVAEPLQLGAGTPTILPPMRAAVLVNRSAGSVVRTGLTAEEVRAAFAAAGVEAEVRLLAGGEVAAAARAAVRNGFGAVVAAGGDGTIRCVAGALAD